MSFDPRASVQAGLDHLATRLDPIITEVLRPDLQDLPWTEVLVDLDLMRGARPRVHRSHDLQSQLKMLTRRLGSLGFPFDDHRQTAGTLGRELTIVRNAWAHGDPMDSLDAWRAHDHCVRLLEYFGDDAGLVTARELRQAALVAYVRAAGLEPTAVPAAAEEPEAAETPEEAEPTSPDPEVFTREEPAPSSAVANRRPEFQPWQPVPVGDVSVLDDLPKQAAKLKVRAVASEIVAAEGPIHADRLATLVAASFGLRKVHTARATKILRQVKSAGMLIDRHKFVWPEDVSPSDWTEFRPSDSTVDRPFLHISPVEIRNARDFLLRRFPTIRSADLDAAVLRTFGRQRRTKQFLAHLARVDEPAL